MTDTPRSDKSQTRFSTPVPDLDDHRYQSPLPRAHTLESITRPTTRRGTVTSMTNQAPDLSQVNSALTQGMVARDFEQAIVDDDNGSVGGNDRPMFGRRGSASPTMARRGTFRRAPTATQAVERPNRSRSSSTSSRSVSPPNSVDAFAGGRRRAGTLNSQAPSELDLTLHRTVSGSTSHRRRPTFSSHRPNDEPDDDTASRKEAEDDVCFPQDEKPTSYKIDYEELEEFVAEQKAQSMLLDHERQRRSTSSTRSRPIFHDLRKKTSILSIPNNKVAEKDVIDSGDSGVICDEKDCDHKDSKCTVADRRASMDEPTKRWTFFSSEMDESVHAAELGDLLMPGESFRDLFELPEDGGVWWLDMLNPSEEEIKVICKSFRVHPLTLEDITTRETREKVELFPSYYFLLFRSFYQIDKTSEDFMKPIDVYAVVFREGCLTFTFNPNPHASNVRKRIGKLRDYLSLTADWVCYALIDDIVDSFGPVIRDVEYETEAIEDQVFTARMEDSTAILRQIGECRKKVMSLLRLLGGKADVIKGFAKRCNEQYSVAPRGDVGLYLSDIQDHVVTMMSNLAHFEKMLSRSHANYLAQISVTNIASGNKINETLGKVTFYATILVPLNLICGLFGMNVPVPGMNSNSLGWFFGILGIIVCIVLVTMGFARRARLI